MTPFGFASKAAEVVAGVDLSGKRCIVTLAVRRPDAAEETAVELRASTGNAAIDVRFLDLADLRSVRQFVDDWRGPLHILVNNAGIMAVPERELTPQGFAAIRDELSWALSP